MTLNEDIEYEKCKYCHQAMQKVDCAKKHENNVIDDEHDYTFSIHEFITFLLWVISLFVSSYKEKLEQHKYKITCVNKDCLGYLNGCYVNRKINILS